jgi:RimJ/RimL family protein N-acetyltransferase
MSEVSYPEQLETPRLLLRRWRPDDAQALTAIWNDPDVWESLSSDADKDPRAAAATGLQRYLHHWERHGFGLWAVIPRDDGAADAGEHRPPIGWIGAWYPDFVPDLAGEIEIAWTLRTPFWGRGLATEGARTAVSTTFDHLGPPRVISLIAEGNDRSAAVATRLGMHRAGETTTDLGDTLRVYSLSRT